MTNTVETSVSLCVLSSGSSGNSTLIHCGDNALLIDTGLSVKKLTLRLEEAKCPVPSVRGICISHEHSDHVSGLSRFCRINPVPVYTNRATSEALLAQPGGDGLAFQIFQTGQSFVADSFAVTPFAVPHDAVDPVGYIVEIAGVRIGVVTDMGMATTLIRGRLKDCHALVVEANHDEQLLRDSRRPEHLKQRIRGRQGHLSNQAAAALLAEVAGPQLQAVFLAHLSEDCNKSDLALRTVQRGLASAGHTHVAVHLTYPDRISTVWRRSMISAEASVAGRSEIAGPGCR